MSYQQQALKIVSRIGDRTREITSLTHIGNIHYAQGRYTQALEFYQQALIIARELGTRGGEATALNNIGTIYGTQNKYPQALAHYQQALAIKREIGDRSSEANTLANIATDYSEQGEYAKALELLEQALSISQTIGERASEATYLNAIGITYTRLGQYPQALKSHKQALTIAREIGSRSVEAMSLGNIGVTYRRQESYAEALKQYQQALALARDIGDRTTESKMLSNLGYVYQRQGEKALALESFQQALAISRETGERYREGFVLGGLGLVYQASGRDAQALQSYQQAMAIQQEIGDKEGIGSTLTYLGKLYNSLGQYAEAETSLFQAVEIWETLRGSGLNDENKISLFETQAETYRSLQQSLIAENKTNEALEAAERGRARAFVELLSKQFSKSDTSPETKPPSLEQIKQIAKQENATLVEYSIIPNESVYIWVIKPTGEVTFRRSDLKPLQQQKTSLADLVSSSRDSMGARDGIIGIVPRPGFQQRQEASLTQQLQQLHQLLIEPIADQLPTDPNDRVIFMPQAELFLVPFPALKDQQGKYLIEKHTILTAPAIQVLELTRQQRDRVGARMPKPLQAENALVVGNPTMPSVRPAVDKPPQQLPPLPGAEREAIAIASLLNTKALTGNAATETAVKAKLPQARIVHLATHGLLDDTQGLRSAIALAPNSSSSPLSKGGQEGGDGLLTAEEILSLKLNAELVILSACNTGRGHLTGDGVIGLSRSLIAAGTPSVIVSLWSVPDAPTEELMSEFYRQLQRTGNKAQALRIAMLKMKEKYPNTPKSWAAFTLIGEAE
jgi:CHAT domain-containing protein